MFEVNESYKSSITANYKENADAAAAINEYIHHSPLCYHGKCVYTLQIPKIFSRKEINDFHKIVDITYGIFCKVIHAYLTDPAYRSLFPFPKEMEELILTDRGYVCPLPIARFDIFYNEENGSFKFCEINTDGTSAMNEDYVLNKAFELNSAHKEFKKQHFLNSWELFDSWVREFIHIYRTYPGNVEKPFIAIVDFLENGSIYEFDEFKERFQKAGFECEVCEIKELKYRDNVLYTPDGHKIDVIYRRAVTSDVFAHINEVQDFIQAVKDQNVCIIGSFCTQIIHNKWLFKIIRSEETFAFLTKEEQEFVSEHIPLTSLLSDDGCCINEVLSSKDKYIIKPLDSYASQGVFAGCDLSEQEWKKIVLSYKNKNYIVQEYCRPFTTENICFTDKDPQFKPYTNMSGLYVYNGKFSGVYSRLSDGGIISSQYNERSVPSYFIVE